MLCCSYLPLMCFRAAYTYRPDVQELVMQNGFLLERSKLEEYGFKDFMEPVFELGEKVAEFDFDDVEAAYLSVLLFLQCCKYYV